MSIRIEYFCFGNNCGYSSAARTYIKALDESEFDVSVVLFDSQWNKDLIKGEEDYYNSFLNKFNDSDAIQIYHCIPDLQRRMKSRRNSKTIGFATFETHDPPLVWKKILDRNTAIISPSRFCQDEFKKIGLNSFYVPHGIDLSIWNHNVRSLDDNNYFTFLFVGEWRERKGIKILLDAWKKFRSSERVRLIIKSNKPSQIYQAIRSLGNSVPPIFVDTNIYNEKDMACLYKSADVIVAPSLGEGFGLAPLHALALNIPVIAPIHTGFKDYLNSSFCIECSVDKVKEVSCLDKIPQFRNKIWYFVSSNELYSKMKYTLENYADCKEKASKGCFFVRSQYNIDVLEKQLKRVIKHVATN